MRAQILQHVAFEGPGSIEPWLVRRGADVAITPLYADAVLPDPSEADLLVILGGPMSVHDEARLPWLRAEKRYLGDVLAQGIPVLGICLGAQLLASVAGARVYRAREREIGWFEVERVSGDQAHPCAALLPARFSAFHWHGETFELPRGAVHLARSGACKHQAFALGDHVLGLQFHLETTPTEAQQMIAHGQADLAPGPYVQSPAQMTAQAERFTAANALLDSILERLLALAPKPAMPPSPANRAQRA